jgi:hypothetical protein
MVKSLNQYLLKGLENKHSSNAVKSECLKIYTDVFKRFGPLCLRERQLIDKSRLMQAISALIINTVEVSLRKNASSCMGAFAVVLETAALQTLVNNLLTRAKTAKAPIDALVQIQCLSLVAKTVGNKLNPLLTQLIPVL